MTKKFTTFFLPIENKNKHYFYAKSLANFEINQGKVMIVLLNLKE